MRVIGRDRFPSSSLTPKIQSVGGVRFVTNGWNHSEITPGQVNRR